ncbi:endocuticle structural glycoprotein SgAbd-4-like [Cataglyphis hispanica]|uniref:endocuticle structural glycoprotein SgAbd-4-like n=1 Tax=Cataglyphis hispanica TaxID=1086592 RepID=UPI00218012C4|nr:endocuticle structural glycoprotein SgAbd-4-like [Cataglyphis hispanica]
MKQTAAINIMNTLIVILCCVSAVFALPVLKSNDTLSPNLTLHISGPSPDGSYNYNYETGNGIQAQEQGQLVKIKNGKEDALFVQGSFSYSDPDGKLIALNYVADENGFQPTGDHLPTVPPIPSGILKALEYFSQHPEEDSL